MHLQFTCVSHDDKCGVVSVTLVLYFVYKTHRPQSLSHNNEYD